MANRNKSVPENVPGDFFVDTTCIDCDTCRQLAPAIFGQAAEYSFVQRQPATDEEMRASLHALLACPTGSIGAAKGQELKQAAGDFPLLVEEPVYYCGYTSPKSFGGSSYFVRHAAGNWLIDSPKFLPQLTQRFEQLGGIAYIFLTHQDDVADAEKYARHFGARRYIHRLELESQPDAEVVLDGFEPIQLAQEFLAIPTPGHTAGHCVLLFRDRFLFTGDHLWWDRDDQRLGASRSYCWHSWPEQIDSMQRLANYRFEWVLPGHGQRVQLAAEEMRRQLLALTGRMQGTGAMSAAS